MFSGMNGGNCLLSSMARCRVESNNIKSARIEGTKGQYQIIFDEESVKWEGKPLVLSSSRLPFEPRIFKSLDGAMSEIQRIGLSEAVVKISTDEA